jgi:hypothetical protein
VDPTFELDPRSGWVHARLEETMPIPAAHVGSDLEDQHARLSVRQGAYDGDRGLVNAIVHVSPQDPISARLTGCGIADSRKIPRPIRSQDAQLIVSVGGVV